MSLTCQDCGGRRSRTSSARCHECNRIHTGKAAQTDTVRAKMRASALARHQSRLGITPEIVARVVAHQSAGMFVDEIAATVGLRPYTVRRLLYQAGIDRLPRQVVTLAEPRQAACTRCGHAYETTSPFIRNCDPCRAQERRNWTPEQRAANPPKGRGPNRKPRYQEMG